MFTEKENKIQNRLYEALDRLEIYFTKREDILNDSSITQEEKFTKLKDIKNEYGSGLKVTDLIN